MKPMCPRAPERVALIEFRGLERHLPETDYCLQSGFREWRGYSSGDDAPEFRKLGDLRRKFLLEAAREHTTEMVVFVLMILPCAWLITYMAITVVTLLGRAHP
jgi:hypothetical protein